MPFIRNSVLAASASMCWLASPSLAQDRALAFSVTGGVAVAPSYFGASDSRIGPTGALGFTGLRFGALQFSDPDRAPTVFAPGTGVRGSFRLLGKREGKDELEGLDDVDLSVEVGLGIYHTAENWQVFSDMRFAAIGHGGVAFEVGGDFIYRGQNGLVIYGGPRADFGNARFMRRYFGITANEETNASLVGNTNLTEFSPSGGLYSYGVELGAYQPLSADWGVSGSIRFDRLHGDAADSPIVQQGRRDQISARIGLTRHFNLRF